jgi:hypothetical protein
MTCFVQRTEDFGGFLPSEVAKDYDSEDGDDPPAYFIRINGKWGAEVLLIDAHQPFDTLLKTKLYCLPIMKGKGLMDDDSCRCLVLERTTKEPGVFKRCGTLLLFHVAHNINADNGWIAQNAGEQGGRVILNEEWFDSGEANADGKYTITII